MSQEHPDPAIPHWSAALEVLRAKHFACDIALDTEYYRCLAEDDLLGASSVLHDQAMQEKLLGESAAARTLAGTAIEFADLYLSLAENQGMQVPGIVARYGQVHEYDHNALQEALNASDAEAILDTLDTASYRVMALASMSSATWPYKLDLVRTQCYVLEAYSDIAQDRFLGIDPSVEQRNRALQRVIEMVDYLLLNRDKGITKIPLIGSIKLELLTFAFDLIVAHEPHEAARGKVLEVKDACFQRLNKTVEDLDVADKINHTKGYKLSTDIVVARHEIATEQQELGLKTNGSK